MSLWRDLVADNPMLIEVRRYRVQIVEIVGKDFAQDEHGLTWRTATLHLQGMPGKTAPQPHRSGGGGAEHADEHAPE